MIKKILNYIKNWIWMGSESYKKDFVIRNGDSPKTANEKLHSQYARGDIKPVLDRPEVVRNIWKERFEAEIKEKADLFVFGESSTEMYGESNAFDVHLTDVDGKDIIKQTKAEDFELKWQIDQMIREL